MLRAGSKRRTRGFDPAEEEVAEAPPPVVGEPIVIAQPAPDAVVEAPSTSDGRVRCGRHCKSNGWQCKHFFVPKMTMHGKMQKWCPHCQAVVEKGNKKYKKTDKGKAKIQRSNASDNGKASQERYLQSDKGKAKLKRKRTSENGKASQKRRLERYLKTEKGKAMVKRRNDKLSHKILSKIWGMCHDGGIQSVTALQATGCASNEELRSHFESTFEPWMHWGNQGKHKAGGNSEAWQIGHRLARAFYNHSNPEDILRCWNTANIFAQDADENHRLKVKMPDDTTLERLRALNLLPCAWNGIVPPAAQRAAMERTVSLPIALR